MVNTKSASIFGPISLLKGNKYILSAENTDIDADNYKIGKDAKVNIHGWSDGRSVVGPVQASMIPGTIEYPCDFCISEKDILESSVSSPLVDEERNSAGDSPHLDAPLWILSPALNLEKIYPEPN